MENNRLKTENLKLRKQKRGPMHRMEIIEVHEAAIKSIGTNRLHSAKCK